jgi:hypothetical protein
MSYSLAADDDCLEEASAKVASLDAKIMNLAKNWNPTGFYKAEDLLRMVNENFRAMTVAADLARAAPLSTSDAKDVIKQATSLIQSKFADAERFVKTAHEAQKTGKLVEAPDFKKWVLGSMQAQQSAILTAAVLECNMPWLASAIIAYMSVLDPIIDFIRSVAGEIKAVGAAVLAVPGQIADALDKMVKLTMIAGGAYLAYQLFFKKK